MKRKLILLLFLLPAISLNSGWVPFIKGIYDVSIQTLEIRLDTTTQSVRLFPVNNATVKVDDSQHFPRTSSNGRSVFKIVEYKDRSNYTFLVEKTGYEAVSPITSEGQTGTFDLAFVLFDVDNLRAIEENIKTDMRKKRFAEALSTVNFIKRSDPEFYSRIYFANLHNFEREIQENLKTAKRKPIAKIKENNGTIESTQIPVESDFLARLTKVDKIAVKEIQKYLALEELNAAQDMLNVLRKTSETVDYFTIEILQARIDRIRERQKMEAWFEL